MKRPGITEPQGIERQLRAQVRSLWAAILVLTVALLGVAALTGVGLIQSQDGRHRIAVNTHQVARSTRSAAQQNVDARYDDCQSLNRLLAGLRAQARQSRRTAPLLYHLVPSLHTHRVERLERRTVRRELREYRRLRCRAYALHAVPPWRRGQFHTP